MTFTDRELVILDAQLAIVNNDTVWVLVPVSVFYGVYTVLLVQCLRSLAKRRGLGFKWQITSLSIVFFLVSVWLLLDVVQLYKKGNEILTQIVPTLATVIFTAGDVILIHRCYLLWGRKKIIQLLYLPFVLIHFFVLLYLTNVIKLGAQGLDTCALLFFVTTVVTNIAGVFLTAVRLIRIRSMANRLSYNTAQQGKVINKRYTVALSLILESGFLYIIVSFVMLCMEISNVAFPFNPDAPTARIRLSAQVLIGSMMVVLAAFLPTFTLWTVTTGYNSTNPLDLSRTEGQDDYSDLKSQTESETASRPTSRSLPPLPIADIVHQDNSFDAHRQVEIKLQETA